MDRKHYRRWVVVVLFIGFVVTAPSLFLGFITDDFPIGGFLAAHLFQLPGTSGHWWDLFRIVDFVGKEASLHSIRMGDLAWWASPEIRIAFFRPLSVVTHYLDYILWPTRPEFMHGQNVIFYLGILLGLGVYYRRIVGVSWVATLALFLFCIDDAHLATVGWIAGRNTVFTVFLAVWTLVSYDRWRRDKWRLGAYLTPILFLLALLCSEAAIGLWAHFLAYVMFLDPSKPPMEKQRTESRRNRKSDAKAISRRDATIASIKKVKRGTCRYLHLWPFLLITVVWRTVYSALGYGVFASGLYTDPVRSPLRFFELFPDRLLVAVGELFAIPSCMSVFAGPYWQSVFVWSSIVVLVFLIWGLVPLLSDSHEIKYWGGAALLGFLPLCTTLPAPRLMLFSGIAGFALIAHIIAFLIRTLFGTTTKTSKSTISRIVLTITKPLTYSLAGFFLVLHLLVSPVYALVYTEQLKMAADYYQIHASFLPSGPAVDRKVLVVLNTPDYLATSMSPFYHALDGKIHPALTLVTGVTKEAVVLSRPKEDTLQLRVEGGYLDEPTSTLFRDPGIPFEVGYRVNYATITVTVQEVTRDGRPRQISLKFPNILHPDWLFAVWKNHGYELIDLPRIGQRTVVPAINPAHYFQLHYEEKMSKGTKR